MGYQTVNHACGHEHRHQLYGPHRERDRKAEWLASDVCPACADAAKVPQCS